MKKSERVKMVKVMEFIARQINDEDVFESWLMAGVADEDINYGDLTFRGEDDVDLDYYTEDETFADLMLTFLRVITRARKSGGLWCDGVRSAVE